MQQIPQDKIKIYIKILKIIKLETEILKFSHVPVQKEKRKEGF